MPEAEWHQNLKVKEMMMLIIRMAMIRVPPAAWEGTRRFS
jgi:hypothetical protein